MILLSFDIEEFDTPTEYGVEIAIEDQIRLSIEGTKKILSILDKHQTKATFFCTANFALRAPLIIEEIVAKGHEIASHGYFHSSFEVADLKKSKDTLEKLTKTPVYGYRMARMMPVSDTDIKAAGYSYNSSLNPTFIPGRYNNLSKPRRWFMKDDVFQIPASVTPFVRFPLFWLSFHNLPAALYRKLAYQTLKHDKYLNIYFHPWEFLELKMMKEFKLPFIMTNNSGHDLVNRLDTFINYFKQKGYSFHTFATFIKSITIDGQK